MTQIPARARELTVGQLAGRSGSASRDRLTGCIGCIGCGRPSMTSCQLANPDDVLGRGGNGPRNLRSGQRSSGQAGHG